MARAKYELHVNATPMRHCLAEIEQGNPLRMWACRTLSDAVAIGNALRFAAGLPMVRGPRRLAVNSQWAMFNAPGEPMDVRIVRREA